MDNSSEASASKETGSPRMVIAVLLALTAVMVAVGMWLMGLISPDSPSYSMERLFLGAGGWSLVVLAPGPLLAAIEIRDRLKRQVAEQPR